MRLPSNIARTGERQRHVDRQKSEPILDNRHQAVAARTSVEDLPQRHGSQEAEEHAGGPNGRCAGTGERRKQTASPQRRQSCNRPECRLSNSINDDRPQPQQAHHVHEEVQRPPVQEGRGAKHENGLARKSRGGPFQKVRPEASNGNEKAAHAGTISGQHASQRDNLEKHAREEEQLHRLWL